MSSISEFNKWTFPPEDLSQCIAIVCNGEMDDIRERIILCSSVLGVDGGINHCVSLEIFPKWIVGDFDSVHPEILEKFMKASDATPLQRAKDETDLEVAITRALSISNYAQVVIFGGFGGRAEALKENVWDTLKRISRLYGWKVFYRGLPMKLARTTWSSTIVLLVLDHLNALPKNMEL